MKLCLRYGRISAKITPMISEPVSSVQVSKTSRLTPDTKQPDTPFNPRNQL